MSRIILSAKTRRTWPSRQSPGSWVSARYDAHEELNTRIWAQLVDAKGCTLTFFVDESKRRDSLDYHLAEVFYDGEPGSDPPKVPGHWHKRHDEHMTVLQGRVEFFMDGRSYVRGPGDPMLVIPRRHVQGFRCFRGEAARIQERTNPVDEGIAKDEFFEDMLSDGTMSMSSAFRAAYAGDTVLALTGVKVVDEALRIALGSLFTWWYPRTRVHEGKLADGVLAQ